MDYALDLPTPEDHGVWGGTGRKERMALRKTGLRGDEALTHLENTRAELSARRSIAAQHARDTVVARSA